jgi:hypothetical protein
MGQMHKAIPMALILAIAAIAQTPPTSAAATTSTPAPKSETPPPQIYHIITRPLCSELHKHIAPAIGMMLQNDQNIKKGPGLFSNYNRDSLDAPDNSASNNAGPNGGVVMSGESGGSNMTAGQNMALLGMENLVSPIANNIIATQKLLDTPALMQGTGNPDDDKQLQDIRAKLLKALATQNAALDIISGFVATQQMGDLQHAGQEFISAMNQPDTTKSGATPSPNPLMVDPNQAGLPANPYDLNLAAIPGLALGYNPVTRLLEALHWTIQETTARENEAAKTVMNSAALCAAGAPKPIATTKP